MSKVVSKSGRHEIISRTDLSDESTSRWIVRSKSSSFLLVDLDAVPHVGHTVAFKFDSNNDVVGFTLFEKFGKIDMITEIE